MRLLDVGVAVTGLVFLSPLLLFVALLIKLTSWGPVFYKATRIGKAGRPFVLYKFRSMCVDADKQGPTITTKDDDRITSLGRLLRRTKIDELPQLINVLKGEMSLVGPRPLPVRDVEGFNKDWQRRRFSVRPGITCLWQVNGRSDLPFQKWMELDMEYIDQWSLWQDLKILAKTLPAVLRGMGAV